MVDLRNRRAEAVLELSLRGFHVLALPFERASLGKVQLDAEDADVASPHGAFEPAYEVAAGAGSSSVVRSTSLVS